MLVESAAVLKLPLAEWLLNVLSLMQSIAMTQWTTNSTTGGATRTNMNCQVTGKLLTASLLFLSEQIEPLVYNGDAFYAIHPRSYGNAVVAAIVQQSCIGQLKCLIT